jgi:pimeloyl-ACP methyl ester carboxylesterase
MPVDAAPKETVLHRTVRYLLAATKIAAVLVAVLLAAGFTYQRYATSRDLRQMPPPGRIVTVGELEVHIHCRGDGAPSIILDPGAGSWSTHWAHVQRSISDHARICLYDRPGLGWSERSPVPLTAEQRAQVLHDLLVAAGEEPPYVLVGHSLGGYLSRIFIDQYPDEVVGLVLADSAHEDQWEEFPAELRATMTQSIAHLRMAVWMARIGMLRLTGTPAQGLPTAQQEGQVQLFAKTAGFFATVHEEFEAGFSGIPEAVKQTGSLNHTPLLVISAGRSAMTYCALDGGPGPDCHETQTIWDRLQGDLLTLSTASRQVILPEATHAIHIDEPQRVAELIVEFADSLAPPFPGDRRRHHRAGHERQKQHE